MKTKFSGFALPTILIASIIMLSVLVAAIASTIAIRSSLIEQNYTQLAHTAADAGTTYASTCLKNNNNIVTWSNSKPLKPNTDCSGNVVAGLSPYVLAQDDLQTYFVVAAPTLDTTGRPISLGSKGYIEVIRQSTGVAWRIWGSDVTLALSNNADNLPVGTSIDGYWSTPPTGYLLENGAAISRTTYSALFAVIGTTFGAGNGSTTFNLPDSRGRVIVNKSTDAEFNALGKKYGEKTHTLTAAEMPSHTHTGTTNSAGNHRHASYGCISCGGSNGAMLESWGGYGSYRTTYSHYAGTHSHTFTTNSAGSGSAHNNIPPSIVALRAIKY